MLLYHDPRAPNPRRVRIFLAEKGVAYDTIEVLDRERREPERRVPAEEPARAVAGARARRRPRSCASRSRSAATSRSCTPSRTCSASTRGSARRSSSGTGTPSSSCCSRSRRCSATRTRSGRAGSSRSPEFAQIMREHVAVAVRLARTASSRRGSTWPATRFTVADITALCAIDFGKVSELPHRPGEASAPRRRGTSA